MAEVCVYTRYSVKTHKRPTRLWLGPVLPNDTRKRNPKFNPAVANLTGTA